MNGRSCRWRTKSEQATCREHVPCCGNQRYASLLIRRWCSHSPWCVTLLLYLFALPSCLTDDFFARGMLRCNGNMYVPSLLGVAMYILDVVFIFFWFSLHANGTWRKSLSRCRVPDCGWKVSGLPCVSNCILENWFSLSAWSKNVGWETYRIKSVIGVILSVIHLPAFSVIRCNFVQWKENKKR